MNPTFFSNPEKMLPCQSEAVYRLISDRQVSSQCIFPHCIDKIPILAKIIKRRDSKNNLIICSDTHLFEKIKNYFELKIKNSHFHILKKGEKGTLEKISKLFKIDNSGNRERRVIIATTYDDCDVLCNFKFDLGLFLSSHKIIINKKINAKFRNIFGKVGKNIYFTQTPQIIEMISGSFHSMSDNDMFGNISFNYQLRRAINDGNVSDFKMISYVVPPFMAEIIYKKYIKKCKELNFDDIRRIIISLQIGNYISGKKFPAKILVNCRPNTNLQNFSKILYLILSKIRINFSIFYINKKMGDKLKNKIACKFEISPIPSIIILSELPDAFQTDGVSAIFFAESGNTTSDIIRIINEGIHISPSHLGKKEQMSCKNRQKKVCEIVIPVYFDRIRDKYDISILEDILNSIMISGENIAEYFDDRDKLNISFMPYENIDYGEIFYKNEKYDLSNVLSRLKKKMSENFRKYNKYIPHSSVVFGDIKSNIWSNILTYSGKDIIGDNQIIISASDIKKSKKIWPHGDCQFEPRLLCKQDNYEGLPIFFKRYGLCLISVANGKYLLTNNNVFVKINPIKTQPLLLKKKENSCVLKIGEGESQLIDNLLYDSVFENYNFIKGPILYGPIFGGRHRCSFRAILGEKTVKFNGCQFETDGCFESENEIAIIEAKIGNIRSFNIRQIYFPFREIHKHCGKIKNIFAIFIFRDKQSVIHIMKYEWNNYEIMMDLKCTKYEKFIYS